MSSLVRSQLRKLMVSDHRLSLQAVICSGENYTHACTHTHHTRNSRHRPDTFVKSLLSKAQNKVVREIQAKLKFLFHSEHLYAGALLDVNRVSLSIIPVTGHSAHVYCTLILGQAPCVAVGQHSQRRCGRKEAMPRPNPQVWWRRRMRDAENMRGNGGWSSCEGTAKTKEKGAAPQTVWTGSWGVNLDPQGAAQKHAL